MKPTFFIGMLFMMIAIVCFVYIAVANKKFYDTGEKPDKKKIGAIGGIATGACAIGLMLMLIF